MAKPTSSTIDLSMLSPQGEVTTLLEAVTASGASDAVEDPPLHKILQVFGTFTATVELEGSMDNTNWVSIGSITAPGKIANAESWKRVRANVTAYTSGTITAILGY